MTTKTSGGTRCSVRGCSRPSRSLGYCSTHYQRVLRTGKAGSAKLLRSNQSCEALVGSKVCSLCKSRKRADKFNKWSRSADGLNVYCKSCQNAYQKGLQKAGAPKAKLTGNLKKCSVCGKWKAHLEFSANQSGLGGLNSSCKACEATRSRVRYQKTLGSGPKFLGVTGEVYEQMLLDQGGGCAICGRLASENAVSAQTGLPVRLSVDHNHKTGQLRSLLCSWCNIGIGHFKEDTNLLMSAVAYLVQHEDSEGVKVQ